MVGQYRHSAKRSRKDMVIRLCTAQNFTRPQPQEDGRVQRPPCDDDAAHTNIRALSAVPRLDDPRTVAIAPSA
jgi:hypothetical protein